MQQDNIVGVAQALHQCTGGKRLAVNRQTVRRAMAREHHRHRLRDVHQLPAPALQSGFVLEKSLPHAHMRQAAEKLAQHVAKSIFLGKIGALPMGLDHHEPNSARQPDQTPALPRRPLCRAVRAPLAFEAGRVGGELETAFSLRPRFTITKLQSIVLQPPFESARPGAFVKSQDALGLLHQSQQSERGLPNPLELALAAPRRPSGRTFLPPPAGESSMAHELQPTLSFGPRLSVGKMKFTVADRSFDRAAILLHRIHAVHALAFLLQVHGAERSKPAA